MSFLFKLRQWLKSFREDYYARQQAKKAHMLDQMSYENINVVEFDGRLYISYNGIPIVRADDLKTKVPELLAQARIDYLAWKERFNK